MKNSAATKPGQTAEKFSIERRQVLAADYLLFLPKGYGASSNKRWPLILFLHGAGERGSHLRLVTKHGPPKMGTTGANLPFIVVSPQCPKGKIWSNDLLLAQLDDIESRYAVDTHRVYLTGLSMGGFGTWSLGLRHPERFAAIAPVCGGASLIELHLADKSKLMHLPVWVFHGAKDPVIPLEESERAVNCLKKLGVREVKFTVYPKALHDSWTATYANPELFAWFLKHSR
ncbi:MAG: alpha/beta hydrolase-fold protein [Verrucomicrobiales bacterium]|nr:alpha/beta hydrolase-fold protein [Verrucomicrobiales bacterium]